MLTWLIHKIFGAPHERARRRLQPKVAATLDLESDMALLSGAALRGKTAELKEKLRQGATLNDLLVPAFAACREAAHRALKMRHRPEQLLGGMVLHEGSIAEMKTGEGKTLTAALTAYLNALAGAGVHVFTANEYLARRDAAQMGKIYSLLGMETGLVLRGRDDEEKKRAYDSDVTYGGYTELAMDHLRAPAGLSARGGLQRPLHFAIFDDADAILLEDVFGPRGFTRDEGHARTTLAFQDVFKRYPKICGLTATADAEAAELRTLYKVRVVVIPTHRPLIRADHEDIVYKTEREMFTAVLNELLDRHGRGQPVLLGATGSEKSAALSDFLWQKGIQHSVLSGEDDEQDALAIAQAGRKGAVTIVTGMAGSGADIVLGGDPEMIARLELRNQYRDPETEPDALAARVRGLRRSCATEGEEVRELGGLYVLGTGRYGSRRMDGWLRGRAGRRGDPGTSRFYLSLQDDLMRAFAGDRIRELMERMGMPDDEPIEHPWVTKAVTNAQKKIELKNAAVRKNGLEQQR